MRFDVDIYIYIFIYVILRLKHSKLNRKAKFILEELSHIEPMTQHYLEMRTINPGFICYNSTYTNKKIEEWCDTVYSTHPYLINSFAINTLEHIPKEEYKLEHNYSSSLLCTMYIPTQEGFKFVFEDPFHEVVTQDIDFTQYEASLLLNHICYVYYSIKNNNEISVKYITCTNIPKYITLERKFEAKAILYKEITTTS